MASRNHSGKNQFTPKQTFWRDIRNKSALTNQQIANAVGLKTGQNVPSYISGAQCPSKKLAQKFCDLFGVPYERGIAEFIKAHAEYTGENTTPKVRESTNERDTFWNRKRHELGLTTVQIAAQIGKNQSMASNYMTGRHMPSHDVILQFCKVFNMTFPAAEEQFIKVYQDRHSEGIQKRITSDPKPEHNGDGRCVSAIISNESNTFLNQLRVKRGCPLRELAKAVGVCPSSARKYLIGQFMPSDDRIKIMCDILGIDFATGKREFEKAFKAAHRGKNFIENKNREVTIKETSADMPAEPNLKREIREMIYKKVEFEVYDYVDDKLQFGYYDEVLKYLYLYGNLDFKTYDKIQKLLVTPK